MSNNNITVISFYSFVGIPEPEIVLPKILLIGKKKYVKGTILIAKEGFNGYLSGPMDNVQKVLDEIIKVTEADDVNIKINHCDEHPFQKLKVKIKKEIIAMNVGDLDVESLKGEYIIPKDWDEFIAKNDVIVVDTRNDYEVEVGTFKGSINPNTETFKQFPNWVEEHKDLLQNKKIAMFCTGGVRCEKSTAYLRTQGFNDLYHLKGGVLQYLEDTQNNNGLWEGECFVFDDRRSVTSDLSPSEGSWLKRA